jgi:hypothetical protein
LRNLFAAFAGLGPHRYNGQLANAVIHTAKLEVSLA